MLKKEYVDPDADMGFPVRVAYCNDQIVIGEDNEKLTIMNEDLEVTKILSVSPDVPESICGNATFLAMGDSKGVVRYYNRSSDVEPMVNLFLNLFLCRNYILDLLS